MYEIILYMERRKKCMCAFYIRRVALAVFNTEKNPFSSFFFRLMIYYCFLYGRCRRRTTTVRSCGLSRKHLFIIKIIITTRDDDNILSESAAASEPMHYSGERGRFETFFFINRPFARLVGSYLRYIFILFLWFLFV